MVSFLFIHISGRAPPGTPPCRPNPCPEFNEQVVFGNSSATLVNRYPNQLLYLSKCRAAAILSSACGRHAASHAQPTPMAHSLHTLMLPNLSKRASPSIYDQPAPLEEVLRWLGLTHSCLSTFGKVCTVRMVQAACSIVPPP